MDNTKLSQGLKDVYDICSVFIRAKKDDGLTFIEELNKIDKTKFADLLSHYGEDKEKIGKIRVDIIKQLMSKNISLDDVEGIKNLEKKNYEKDILKSRKNFSILYAIYYYFHRERVNNFFQELQENIITDLDLKSRVKYTTVDFDGAQNFGLDGFWTAIYNNSHKSQKTALQLNITSFRKGYETLGLEEILIGVGHGPEYNGQIATNQDIFPLKELTYEKIIEEFQKYRDGILEDVYAGSDKKANDGVHYRLYAPGENAYKWDEYYESGYMGIGWDEMGDISNYKDRKAVKDHYIEIYGKEENNNVLACYQFAHEIKIGDIIIVKKGKKKFIGYGTVTSDYIYDESKEEYKSVRKVNWIQKGEWDVGKDSNIVVKTLTEISVKYPEYVEELKKLLGILDSSPRNMESSTKGISDLNTILYGAPGTGKTYHTINYALSIIENKSLDEINNEERSELKRRFDDYKSQGQIVFCTFHQSLSYEEFIEGIKASSDNGTISYSVGDGIFKNIANQASKNESSAKSGLDIDIDDLLQQFGDVISNDLENGDKVVLKDGATIGQIIYNENGQLKSFVTGGTVSNQRLTINIIKRDYPNYRRGLIKSYQDIKPSFDSESKWHGNARYYISLYKKLQEFEKSKSFVKKEVVNQEVKNYVLIIDEINRGNMSKIFGELITLLEPSKRIGAEEELKVKLPYSQDEFGVPQNLYVLGTMNTADRSIALIDIALRRRFTFKEIEPNSGLLNFKVGNIDIQKMFETINQRIEFLYDRDHKLGHSFFMDLKKDNSFNKLNDIFSNNIIPLLQEYFYEDWEKIQIVLGDHPNQHKKKEDKLIQEEIQEETKIIGFNHEDIEDKSKYVINANPSEKSYLGIYSTILDDKKE